MGHDFGESEINREREERGDEVVITIREIETCERCGSERVHSENTEVRPVEPIADVEGEASGSGPDADAPTDATAGTDTTAGTDAAIIDDAADAGDIEDEPAGGMGVDDQDPADAGAFDAADTENPATDPETDDAVILDEEAEPEEHPDRTAGEWPDAEDTRVEEREEVPEPNVEETDEEPEEDAEILGGAAGDADDGSEADTADAAGADAGAPAANAEPSTAGSDAGSAAQTVEAGGWPEQDGVDEGFDAEPGSEKTDVEFSGIAPEGSAPSGETTPSESPSLSADSETRFVCPECGFSEAAVRSSLRAGDICPDCRKGYLREE